jgi:superoxide dismutase, Cu-Zn family
MNKKNIIATSYFNIPSLKGSVNFIENIEKKNVIVEIDLISTYKNSLHGFHIHEAGDLTDNCNGACAHFNPFNKNHGGPNSKERHVGDLGNIKFNSKGIAKYSFTDNLIKLNGTKANIIGRSVVIHQDIDDLGKGGHSDSLTTGHAGKRIACAVIGYSKKMFHK